MRIYDVIVSKFSIAVLRQIPVEISGVSAGIAGKISFGILGWVPIKFF